MWQLQTDENNKRTYVNSTTGSKCTTTKVFTDKEQNDWYSFDDLMSIPYTRQFAATKISSLYALGLSKDDLTKHIEGGKVLCKSDDKEKYEKIYALFLDFETKAANATDAIKQMSSLVCVYNMINDEVIDSFDTGLQVRKMAILEADPDAHSFFLKLQIHNTERYMEHLKLLSAIVSQPMEELPEVLG